MSESHSLIKGCLWLSVLLCWVATLHQRAKSPWSSSITQIAARQELREGGEPWKKLKKSHKHKNLCWWTWKDVIKGTLKGQLARNSPDSMCGLENIRRQAEMQVRIPPSPAIGSGFYSSAVSGLQLAICVRQGTLLRPNPHVKNNWAAGRGECHVGTKESQESEHRCPRRLEVGIKVLKVITDLQTCRKLSSF